MDMEKYTERAKGFLQAAQTLALGRGHQRMMPEHLLKVLLDDKEGLCANLIRAAGGDPTAATAAVDAELAKLPKVEGSGAAQVYMAPEMARLLEQAEKPFHAMLPHPRWSLLFHPRIDIKCRADSDKPSSANFEEA